MPNRQTHPQQLPLALGIEGNPRAWDPPSAPLQAQLLKTLSSLILQVARAQGVQAAEQNKEGTHEREC